MNTPVIITGTLWDFAIGLICGSLIAGSIVVVIAKIFMLLGEIL